MERAIDRLDAELESLTERIALTIIERVPGYRRDPVAQAMLLPLVRQNADEVLRVFRGVETTTAAARNVALVYAGATTLSLDAVEQTFMIARDAFGGRLSELADDGEDLTGPLQRLGEAYAMVIEAIREEYRDAKARQAQN